MAPAMLMGNPDGTEIQEDQMPAFTKLSRTDISAMVSVLLFGMTILISAVGPAEAQGSILTGDDTVSPTVSHVNASYRA